MSNKTEQEIVAALTLAQENVLEGKRIVREAKKRWLDAETNLIGDKLKLSKLEEELRRFRWKYPEKEITARDLDIERFRKEHPELCALAKDRDALK